MPNENRPVDLTNCDREPIHIPGSIQSVGFLLALTADWIVARASSNADKFLGKEPKALIGLPLAEVVPAETVHELRNKTAVLRGPGSVERMFKCILVEGSPPFDVAVHFSGGQIVLEAELSRGEHGDTSGVVRSMLSRLDQCVEPEAFFREGARQVRALLGYDRVMVYRFAADGSGEVVAEACRSGIGQFMGLRYPASDIPAQARELYKRNLLRLIADVRAAPVPVLPVLDEAGRPLDLSLASLRSVSPIHLEYLKNMGVEASLSISIIVEGKLWGLFACHHYQAMCPTVERRSVGELFGQMFSMRLESRERLAIVEFDRRARDISDQLLGAVASDETLIRNPDWLADILTSIISADGVGVWINGEAAFSGTTPNPDEFRRIVRALNGTASGQVFATDKIGSIVEGAETFASRAAGLLAIPISRVPRDYVILFRRELVRSVRWGGDPHKPVEYGPNGPRLSPRESFEEWKELVQGQSVPFTASETRVAETLRATMIEVVLRLASDASAERQKANERQEMLIAELNHRVRNILGVIRGLIRQSQPGAEEDREFVRVVDGRIHALARAHNQITDDHWGPAPLQALIDAEARAFVHEHGRIISEGEPVLLNPQAYSTMALVVHELVTNATKYGSLSGRDGSVRIGWSRNLNRDLTLTWTESGGPAVTAPSRRGFGTTIIDRSVPYDLGGAASVEYEPTGVVATFTIPARHISEPRTFEGPQINIPRPSYGHPVSAPPKVLAGHDLLLVEDSLIIALDGEDVANRLGANSVTPVSTADAAMDSIDRLCPTVAMLDINLGDRTSFPVADRLAELGVPFLFATGYGEQAKLPDQHSSRMVLQKPYTLENVAKALTELVGGAGTDSLQ